MRLRLDAAGFEHLPSQQIVLTGGASQIPGLDGLAPKILGNQVRIGRPHGCRAAAGGHRSGFASAVGLSFFARPSAGRMVGFRSARRPLRRAVAPLGGEMVQGQLVRRTPADRAA
ncbi:MAG: hypothetical protein R3D80_16045 [Paracoccaceae bacterium]